MLYHKYRPKTFPEMYGNQKEIESFQKLLEKPDRPHVYLMTGPSGTGKTTLARIAASVLGADELSINELNSADNRGIDTAREIIQDMQFKTLNGKPRVFIIDEFHKTTSDFQNAMLKPLEDTPEFCYFFLCTTDPAKVINTIKTRSTIIKLEAINEQDIYRLLRKTAVTEKLPVSKEIIEEISTNCNGSARLGLVLLEKVSTLDNESDMKSVISIGEEAEAGTLELCRLLLSGNYNQCAELLPKLKDIEVEKIRYAVLGYMNAVLLKGTGRAALIIEEFREPFYNSGRAGLTLAIFRCFHT